MPIIQEVPCLLARAGVAIVQNCRFEQNSAESGGALAIEHGDDDVSIFDSVFVFNEAATEGGAITLLQVWSNQY